MKRLDCACEELHHYQASEAHWKDRKLTVEKRIAAWYNHL